MKLVPTTEKVKIQWFWVAGDGTKIRNNKGFVHNAWDVTCSCGWKTRTGGAIRSCIEEEVWYHKTIEHDYKIAPYARRKNKNEFIEGILNGTVTAENWQTFKAGA